MLQKRFSWELFVWSACMLMLGGGIVFSMSNDCGSRQHGDRGQVRSGLKEFTNPLLECEVSADTIASSKEDFSLDLTAFVTGLKKKLEVSEIAVYFRDLNNGPIIGINQNIPFAPASLLKVPIMMTYLGHAEENLNFLNQKIVFKTSSSLLPDEQNILPDQHIELGHTYTVDELVVRMIKYSDNQAMALLYEGLPIAEQVELYRRVGIDSEILTDPSSKISVKQYSIFFRVLFNASYLSRTNSERALRLLSETYFNYGLRAGVPSAIPIAHKFGERKFGDELQQLHDCGIIYYPNHPYLLCVMTRGSETALLQKTIAEISKFVYEKINNQYGI